MDMEIAIFVGIFDIQVTVHCDKIFYNKTTRHPFQCLSGRSPLWLSDWGVKLS
jgi:hypothetical protein